MRLLHNKTLDWNWISNSEAERYWILSHPWHGEEITLQQFEDDKNRPRDQQMQGTKKILDFCAMSRGEVDWVWADTCCIDKTSSAELQEALNSMWRWYQDAEMCVIYMDDVSRGIISEAPLSDDESECLESLRHSRWFKRGWTLQELIAPSNARFVDTVWRNLGTRAQLGKTLEKITLIKSDYYGDVARIRSATVAERMSWMRKRVTKREEDEAYCMLGVFGINMTMLYGEGKRAFMRLQEHIMSTSDDETIFAWRLPLSHRAQSTGLLSRSPSHFLSPRVYPLRKHVHFLREPYRMTNKGVEFEIYGKPRAFGPGDEMLVPLNVALDDRDTGEIKLLQLTLVAQPDGTWLRKYAHNLSEARSTDVPPPESEKSKQSRMMEKINRFDGDYRAFMRSEFFGEQTRYKIHVRQPPM